ncbi:MAG TPA: hypothetical protein VES19_13855 [Candidatus Limnocylindrales bacterium]|nr:hypothetical protein [Candidatus Limnocylindrales bacterium]
MTLLAGIPLIDLFGLPDAATSLLPDSVRSFVDRFVVTGYTTSHSDAAIFHRGSLQPIDTAIDEIPTDFDIGIGRLSLPLLQTGIPFQLAFTRKVPTANLEPAADVWRLDLSLDVFTLTVDGLEPAVFVKEVGTTPRHLVRDTTRSGVRITGSAVLRIEVPTPGASVQVTFIDQPDPLDPAAVSGAVATLTCSPPHFFIGGSEFGLSVGRLQFDFSESYSPPDVIVHQQGPGWMGVAIKEATFYAPRNLPGLGDLSGGVKNVLIGSPVGLQGELEIQFGRSAMNPATFQFEQVTASGDQGLAISGSGNQRIVTIEASEGEDVVVRAGFAAPAPPSDGSIPAGGLQDWTAQWTWPDGETERADASAGTVRHGQVLHVTPIETVTVDGAGTDFAHPDITYRFVAAGTGPTIDATIGTEQFANVTHLGGTVAAVGGVVLAAVTGGADGEFEWQIEGTPQRVTGPTYTPQVAGMTGTRVVILREKDAIAAGDERVRLARLQLQLLATGDLLVGCEAGVFAATDDGTPLALAAVEDTFDLSDFHAEGKLNTVLEQATLDAADPSNAVVPPDGLARVTIAAGPAPVPARDRHVQVRMDFDTANELSWGAVRPANATGGFSQSDLLAWAARYPGADFLVIGRCDDIGSDGYNETLAKDRAARGVALLTTRLAGEVGTPVPAARIASRGEQSPFSGGVDGNTLEEDAEIALSAAERSEAVATPTRGRLIHAEIADSTGWPDKRFEPAPDVLSSHEPVREPYRRIDVYAVGGTPAADSALVSDTPVVGAALRRSLVPAPGRDPAAIATGSPAMDYRVRLRIVWDSPTVSGLRDAIPTLAEAEFAWTPQTMPLPAVGADDVELSREVLTVFVNWTHDARTGYTKAALGIRSEGDPDGLISTTTAPLVAALAFGPALLSGVDADTDLVGSGARIAALLAAIVFAEVDLGGGPLIGEGSKAALTMAALETEMRSISDPGPDMQIRVVTDYVCTLHINGGALGIKTAPDQPMKIRYKRVGIEFDTSKTGWDRVGLVYDTSSMEIEDPGRWQIDGVLGSLLRIVEVAMGTGSMWIEGRIAVALEIGVLEITEAIIRLTFKDGQDLPDFELRGFVLKADIPNVLAGEGRLRIEDGGVIRAGVEATIIPVGIGVEAAIAFAKMGTEADPWIFLSLYLGVQFATPLPLAQSGLAIYGFKGLFTMNGTRALGGNPDPIGRELDWWAANPESKYDPLQGQFALGIGVVVGTMPDASFCVACAGMLVVAFPDIEVILGVDVTIIEVPDTEASDEGGQSGTITGLISIDDEAVKLAVSAQYTIPKVLEVKVPFGGYFPYPGTGQDVYVRLGSDGQTQFGRYGEPVTLKLLPGTLDAQAWTYLMIEQGGLPSLGGDARFSFEGFSVGFGAGFEIGWKAGPIKLVASAKVLIGFGTAPLMLKGGIFVVGELDLVVVSISARGELVIEAREFKQADGSQDVAIKIDGEFCGEVDLFFFSISGCVGVSIDLSPDLIPPAPLSPVKGVSLTDRRDRLMGVATAGTPAGAAVFVQADPAQGSVGANNTVWPDTAPVVHFAHFVENAMPAWAQFVPGPTPTQDRWFGSNALKYAYRLDSLQLTLDDGTLITGDAPLQSVWTTTPYRQPDASGTAGPVPSEHEGPNLKLLDWSPWAWVVNLANGGAGQPGDPVTTVEDLCDPNPVPRRVCVLGRSAKRAGLNRVRLRSAQAPQPPYPSRFFVTGEPVVRLGTGTLRGRPLVSLVTLAGGQVLPGSVVALPFPATIGGDGVDRGYRLPTARRAVDGAGGGLQDIALPWEGGFSQLVTNPSVTLLICDAPGQGTPPDPETGHCDDLRGLKTDGATPEVVRPGMRISTVAAGASLVLVDEVDQSAAPPVLGRDDSGEIRFPDSGVAIVLAEPCDHIEVYLAPQGGAVKGEALAADGSVLASAATPRRPGDIEVLAFETTGMASIRLYGGRGEAVLFRVCCKGGRGSTACETFEGIKPSDKELERVAVHGHTFEVVDPATHLRLSDMLDVRQVPPRPGNDGRAEVFFPRAGVTITLPRPCPAVEVHVMTFTGDPVRASGLDAAGNRVATDHTDGTQQVPAVLVLESRPGESITTVVLEGGGGEAVVYRVCCAGEAAIRTCVDFAEAKLPGRTAERLRHGGLDLRSLAGRADLGLVDRVDASAGPGAPGRDGRAELRFGETGVRITLPGPCDDVELRLMLFKAEPVKAVALDPAGRRVGSAVTDDVTGEGRVLRIAARGITAIDLVGGAGQAVLVEICFGMEGGAGARSGVSVGRGGAAQASPDALAGRAAGATTAVTGIVNDTPKDAWPGTVLDRREGRDGRTCELVRFEPRDPAAGPWDGFRIEPPPGKTVTVVAACGTDQRAADARANDVAVAAQYVGIVTAAIVAEPDKRREIVLEPDTEYQVRVGWSWQAWQPDNPDEQPPDPDPAEWEDGGVDVWRFRTAPDATLTGEPQDGLNEFVFDARDVVRYLIAVEPADGRPVQFTGDPIWVHLDAGHLEQLLEQYGRTLEIEIRRTDPPPQSTPEALAGLLAPLEITKTVYSLATDRQPEGYRRINKVLVDPTAVPCVPEGAPLGGASVAVTAPIEPDADYDLVLVAPRGEDDRPVVHATRFRTSHYAGPRALLDALGYTSPTLAPYLPDDLVLPEGMTLPAGGFVEGDAALDAALAAIDAETLPLPLRRARSYVAWSFDEATGWHVEALIVDSPEPMKRETTVVDTAGVAAAGTRIAPLEARIEGAVLALHRANARWTRVIFRPSAPITLAGDEHVLTLTFSASDGNLSGTRRLRSVPSILEREGL